MDKLTAIKIKYQNGTYSDQIPISALAQNIEWDDQYGLMDVIGDVDVDADGSIQSQIDNIIAEKGAANGIAELDSTGKVPSSQLPSYVDDVLEYDSYNQFPVTGETGKIYVDKTTNLTYRWSGSGYVEISPSLALGETSSTAYRGDRGKTAYDHATESNRLTTATASGFYKVASTSEGHIANLTAVQKSDITGLGVPESDTKNTAGSTDTSSKIFLIGATSQANNPQTYSHDTAYVGADGLLYSGGDQVLTQHQTIKQDGVSGATANRFGVCSTAAATAAKTVSITSGTFNLESGAQVSVKFNNINSADNPTLNVNGTGAKSIFVNSSQITTGSEKLLLKGTVSFVYDGTQWHLIGGGSDSPPVVELTQAQYDALSEEQKNMNVVYMITNGTTNTIVAEDIVYDNTGTILTSNTVQDAIDELARGAVKELTLAQYNALTPAEQNNGTIYYITDDVSGVYANEVMYDNTQSGLNADNVQDALDEVNSKTINAEDVVYSSTSSGLGVANVQAAIDKTRNTQDRNQYKEITTDFNNGIFSNNLKLYNSGNYIKKVYNNTTYVAVLADLNTFRGTQNLNAVVNQDHWVAIVLGFAAGQMNSTNTTENGFTGSAMNAWLKGDCVTIVKAAFGTNHLIAHGCLLTTGTYNPNTANTFGFSWAWENDHYTMLMSEEQIYGCKAWSLKTGFDPGEAWRQLKIFQNEPYMYVLGRDYGQSNNNFNSNNCWLRNISARSPGTDFCLAARNGLAGSFGASDSYGRYPIIMLK